MTTNIFRDLKQPFFALAPMDDVTDVVFRQIVSDCAKPDLFFTEFVNVDGLQSPGRDRLMPRLRTVPSDQPIIAQIWGKNPKNYYQTVKDIITMGYSGVDINMGCPDKRVVKNGCCVALVNNRELAGEIITACKEAANGKISLSVKTRLGFNDIDFSWHEFLLTHGIDALTVHGRTRKQLSNVPADWKAIFKIVQMRDKIAKQTLIIGNGDVTSITMANELVDKFGVDGVMIGRGIFSNPFLFEPNNRWGQYSSGQKLELYKRHALLFQKTWSNNERSFNILKKFCKVYINNFEGASELRDKIFKSQSVASLIALLG